MTYCTHCLRFVHDYLEWNPISSPLSSKRLSPLTNTIASELLRILTKIRGHHNIVKRVKDEYLNLVSKKLHVPTKPLDLHLFDVSLNYYKYMGSNIEKHRELEQTIEMISIELLNHGVFQWIKKESDEKDLMYEAKCWILEKYFFFVHNLKEIHDEHSGNHPIDTNTLIFEKHEKVSDEEIISWNNLYD